MKVKLRLRPEILSIWGWISKILIISILLVGAYRLFLVENKGFWEYVVGILLLVEVPFIPFLDTRGVGKMFFQAILLVLFMLILCFLALYLYFSYRGANLPF